MHKFGRVVQATPPPPSPSKKGAAPTITCGKEGPAAPTDGTLVMASGGVRRGDAVVKICTYCRILEGVLRACKVKYKTVDVDLDDKPEWFVSKSKGTTPALMLEDGDWVHET